MCNYVLPGAHEPAHIMLRALLTLNDFTIPHVFIVQAGREETAGNTARAPHLYR